MTLDTILPACQMAMRKGLSFLLYHEDVIKDTAGVNGPSKRPTKNRQKIKLQALLRAVMEIVTADQHSIQAGSSIRGLPRARITFPGT